MDRIVKIDSATFVNGSYRDGYTLVAVDVIRSTTTAVTGVALGRRCFPAASVDDALRLAESLDDPLLVGESEGSMPDGFDLTNSPAQLAERDDKERPMVLLSTSGTRLITSAGRGVYVACLRNLRAQVNELDRHHPRVLLVGAATRGEFREEDQLCCARIAAALLDRGYEPADEETEAIVDRWRGCPTDAFVGGGSTQYLRRTGQLHDLEFILGCVDDLDDVFVFDGAEILRNGS
ncbi:MAG: 2-phosphosulfolactate phosphatase [Actinobacteria bacterium]|nr:MAG: 2-phosphosulfolactate phosphatase [Actinomycetota bacterium]